MLLKSTASRPKDRPLRYVAPLRASAPASTPQPTEFTPPTEFPPIFGLNATESFANQNENPAVLANGKGVNWGFGGPGNFWWYPQAKCTSNLECGYSKCNASGFCV